MGCFFSGEEIGMLEDMETGISDLHRVTFRITEAKSDDPADLQPVVSGRRWVSQALSAGRAVLPDRHTPGVQYSRYSTPPMAFIVPTLTPGCGPRASGEVTISPVVPHDKNWDGLATGTSQPSPYKRSQLSQGWSGMIIQSLLWSQTKTES